MTAPVAGLPPWLAAPLRGASALGVNRLVSLDPRSLMDAARQAERWDDFGDPSFLRPLVSLVTSLDDEARLHVLGRAHLRGVLVRALRTRLRLRRTLAARPEAAVGPSRPPLIVTGLPRTGTTYLHRLLAALPDLHGLPLWQLIEPLPPQGTPDRRLELALKRNRRMVALSRSRVDHQHLMRPELPDECGHLFRAAFLSPSYFIAPTPSYLDGYAEHDARSAYRDYAALLGLLSAGDPRRLVLKEPSHVLFLPALFEAMPDAMVVQTHRDPRSVVPSFVKLLTTAQALVSDDLDLAVMAPAIQRWVQACAERSVARAEAGALRVFDLDYRDLVDDPVGTVERIHHRFELPFDPAWRDLLHRETAGAHDRTPNPYTAATFGLDEDAIAEAFAPYLARFLTGSLRRPARAPRPAARAGVGRTPPHAEPRASCTLPSP